MVQYVKGMHLKICINRQMIASQQPFVAAVLPEPDAIAFLRVKTEVEVGVGFGSG